MSAMTEQLKFIVQELNKPPFQKGFNLINFDSLDPQQLLQTLSDVLTVIDGKGSVDIRSEAPDETAFRVFNALRLLKYKAPDDPDLLSDFRRGVVEGDKQWIYPILSWIFPRLAELQKRAYLARFLVRVDVPPEFLQDLEVEQLHNQAEQLIEEFKEVHKESEVLRGDGVTSEEIRIDIKSMEEEKEQINKRIEKLKKKVEHVPQREKTLEMSKNLRQQIEREAQIMQQKADQRNALMLAEQRIQRMQQQITELRQSAVNINPEEIIQRLFDDNQSRRYLVQEKIRKEIDFKRKAVQELQQIASQPAMERKDIDAIKKQIEDANDSISKLIEQKNLKSDPNEDKLAIFRQQASMVTRKKEAAAEALQDARQELAQAESDLKEKKNQMRDPEGNEIVTQTQFKNYVNKLRLKSNIYKKSRQELQNMRAETGVLTRTDELLKQQAQQLLSKGQDLADTPRSADEDRTSDAKSTEEIAKAIKLAQREVEKRKAELAPLVQEVRPLREEYEAISEEHSTKKAQYDSIMLNLESNYARLEQDVKALRQEINGADSQHYHLETEKKIIEAHLRRADSENSDAKYRAYRDQLNAKVQKADDLGKKLREEQKNVKDTQQDSAKQIKMWRDVQKIMECKKQCWEKQHRRQITSGVSRQEAGSRIGSAGNARLQTAKGGRRRDAADDSVVF